MRKTILVVMAVSLAGCGGGSSPSAPSGGAAPTPAPTPTPNPRAFGPGQHQVGPDIAAGRYFADPVSGCYWERQSGFSGDLSDVLANNFLGFDQPQEIVDILSTDAGFEADAECGDWFTTQRQGAQNGIPPGRWLVGSQLAPGTYRVNANDGCYWERLSDFTGELGAIVANDFVSAGGQQLVTIAAGDVGFYSDQDCGTWSTSSRGIEALSRGQSQAEIEAAREANRRQEGR
jgi:hypothetical protein